MLPLSHLRIYTVVGLTLVLSIARNVGFREEDEEVKAPVTGPLAEYAEILFQSFVAAFLGLFRLGVIQPNDSVIVIVILRLGLLEVVPLGFGAALANRLFAETDPSQTREAVFPHNVAI
jgi:hypothetical protein